MKNFLKIIRPINIAIIIATQLLMVLAVIKPILGAHTIEPMTPTLSLVLVILGTIFITMAGYIINDYFDTRIDEINTPQRVLIGKAISRQKAMLGHNVLTGIGVLCGLYVAYDTQSITVAMIFIFVPGLLWFYSTAYKRQFFIGNLIIGLITALVPFIVVLVEQLYLVQEYGEALLHFRIVADLYRWVGFFAIFAFLLTILREMVKDIQDEKGDREMECRTVPIVLGVETTRYIIAALSFVLIFVVGYFIVVQLPASKAMSNYLLYGVCAPLLFFVFMLIRARSPKDYALSQNILKVIMVIGVLFSLLVSQTF